MKNLCALFILSICLSFSITLKSQTFIGVKGGVNIPTVNFTDFTNFPINTRFRTEYFTSEIIGVTYRYMSQEKIGIQMDLNYSVKGWGQNTLQFTNTFINKINYLEFPVYMHWEIFGTEKLKFFLDLGVYSAWAISTSQTILTEVDLEENQILYDLEKHNRGDFGVYVGSGISYAFPFGTLQLEGNFKSGFANILPANHITKENPAVSTNQVPAVLMSFIVPINTKNGKK